MTNHIRHTGQKSIIQRLVAKAIGCGADMIEVEYDEGYEEVYIRKDNLALSIDRYKTTSSGASFLRKELYGLAKKKRQIVLDNEEYELRARIYDSFGEDAFRVLLRKL
jgi:predicted secreted protein